MYLRESIIIKAAPETVYNVVSNYLEWPNYLSVNKYVRRLYTDGDCEVYLVKHMVGKKTEASQCRRRNLPPSMIEFELDNKFFEHLEGSWIINKISEKRTELISIHYGTAKIKHGKKIVEKIISEFFFKKTTPVTLKELKEECEKCS